MTNEEIALHLTLVNEAYQERVKASRLGQSDYNRASWKFAYEANWFVLNGIDYHFEQNTICLGPLPIKD